MKKSLLGYLFLCLSLTFPSCGGKEDPQDQPSEIQTASSETELLLESPEERETRMSWWREARFGMFIHWGIYAVPAGEYKGQRVRGIGEWIQAHLNIPRNEYELFAPQFNPEKFDAAEWVSLAKTAGMKYMVITSKHHDGFALFDSKVSDWDVVDRTPYGRDLLVQLKEECDRQGIIFCTYYSILDWHHPAQYPDQEAENPRRGHSMNKIHPDQKEEYVTYMKGQLKEILDNLDVGVLWFDGEWPEWWGKEDGIALYNWLRELKPSLVINNRIGAGRQGMAGFDKAKGYAGDFGTPEQEIPDTGIPGVDWESCMTMNDTWGYKHFDENWKSTETLVRNLVDIASKGGNYLLNIGPKADGTIPEASIERLTEIGAWMNINGESIHGSQASPYDKPEWGRYTRKEGKLYVHVFDWPEGGGELEVPVDKESVHIVYLLDGGQKLGFITRSVSGFEDRFYLVLPEQASNPIDTVIVIE